MSISGGPMKLKNATKKLHLHWEELGSKWNDKIRADFEKEHLEPIEYQVGATLRALDRLAEVLRRAEQECS